jgi:hypothetical protein
VRKDALHFVLLLATLGGEDWGARQRSIPKVGLQQAHVEDIVQPLEVARKFHAVGHRRDDLLHHKWTNEGRCQLPGQAGGKWQVLGAQEHVVARGEGDFAARPVRISRSVVVGRGDELADGVVGVAPLSQQLLHSFYTLVLDVMQGGVDG